MKKFIKAYNNILEQDDIEMEVPVDEPEADPVAEPEPEVQP